MLGYEAEALAVVTTMEEQLEEVRQVVKDYYEAEGAPSPVTVFYEEAADPLSTIGTRSFMHDLITTAGASWLLEWTDLFPTSNLLDYIKARPHTSYSFRKSLNSRPKM